jgi:hypothetical protein
MKYWIRAVAVLLALGAHMAGAEELFPNGYPSKITQYSELPTGSTAGGYPLYAGGRTWYVMENKADNNNMDVRILRTALSSPLDGDFFAEMYVTTSMGAASTDGYFAADLCSPSTSHLFMLNKASGRIDNCLTINPHVAKMQSGEIVLLVVKVRNSQSSWRLYDLTMVLNPVKLGFPATTAADWSLNAIAADPKKKQSFDKIVAWAKQLQDGVNKAIAFSKPQDAFDGVPSIQTLLAAD